MWLRISTYIVLCIILTFSSVYDLAHADSKSKLAAQITGLKVITSKPKGKSPSVSQLENGVVIAIGSGSKKGLTIRAETNPRQGLNVRFRLSRNGKFSHASDRRYPYLFNQNRDGKAGIFKAGSYTLRATPYKLRKNGTRIKGERVEVKFSITQGSADQRTENNPGGGGVVPDASIPLLSDWETQMQTYGSLHCQNLNSSSLTFDQKLAATYYDAEWVFYQIGDYTGDNSWYNCAEAAEGIYADNYVAASSGNVPGYWHFAHGVTKDYLETGDHGSRDAAVLLSTNAAYAPDWTPLSWTEDANMSREVAYAIMSYLNAEKVGASHRERCELLVAQALDHLNQWFVSETAEYVRPFMFALTAHALISYDEYSGGNATIRAAIINGANWIWNHTWLPGSQAFMYTDRVVPSGGMEPAPDLNLLIAPVYAWIWHRTGNEIFRDRADQIFAGGVNGAYLVNGKQFNQNYRWSFDYIKWRSLPPLD